MTRIRGIIKKIDTVDEIQDIQAPTNSQIVPTTTVGTSTVSITFNFTCKNFSIFNYSPTADLYFSLDGGIKFKKVIADTYFEPPYPGVEATGLVLYATATATPYELFIVG